HKPRTTFADKKGTASVSLSSHHVEHWKRSKSATLVVENRKGGYLNMRDNHPIKTAHQLARLIGLNILPFRVTSTMLSYKLPLAKAKTCIRTNMYRLVLTTLDLFEILRQSSIP
ncbi:hypothetical protein, partial [Prevotella melaninogenica]|uniref:hypothetical protein n=1 Tax=Prevotella melaninogenica TaxID=28132 RepID=UPI00242CE4FA